MSLCYLSAIIGITIVNFQTAQLPAYVGITNVFLLMLFIYATAPASGGHLNPLITFATMTTGLTEFPRAILYILGQTIGGAIAGGLIRGSFGSAMTEK
jgi:glycerol uptake facilitator-like aquaporin